MYFISLESYEWVENNDIMCVGKDALSAVKIV